VSDGGARVVVAHRFLPVSGASPAATDHPRSHRVNAPSADLSLAALLDLCSVDEDEPTTHVRSTGTALRERSRTWSVRVSLRGAGAQGSRRAW
jgi:hypothetical protein